MVADGVQKVSLAEAHPSINKKRIIGFAWRIRYRQGGCMSQPVVVADDKGIKSIFRIERRRCVHFGKENIFFAVGGYEAQSEIFTVFIF